MHIDIFKLFKRSTIISKEISTYKMQTHTNSEIYVEDAYILYILLYSYTHTHVYINIYVDR